VCDFHGERSGEGGQHRYQTGGAVNLQNAIAIDVCGRRGSVLEVVFGVDVCVDQVEDANGPERLRRLPNSSRSLKRKSRVRRGGGRFWPPRRFGMTFEIRSSYSDVRTRPLTAKSTLELVDDFCIVEFGRRTIAGLVDEYYRFVVSALPHRYRR
jgi:hypothetical protein